MTEFNTQDHEAGRQAAAEALAERWPSLGIVARAVVRRHPSKREIADIAVDAYLSRVPSPVRGTEPGGMRDYLAMKRRPSMEVSGTEPDTAKLVEAVERVLIADDDRHYLPRQLRQGLTDAFDALAGLSVDAGKPEEER